MKNYFVNLTKLQKLMYCVYGAVLVSSDTRIDFFGKYSAGELVAWSQHPNGAWFKSSKMEQISDDLIIEYFKTLIKKV